MGPNLHICIESSQNDDASLPNGIWPDVEKVAQVLKQALAEEKNPEKRS